VRHQTVIILTQQHLIATIHEINICTEEHEIAKKTKQGNMKEGKKKTGEHE